jgi:hypothetical protein
MTDAGMALNQTNGVTMKNLRTLSAAIALAAILPLATPSASFAAYRGAGPCTAPGGDAVGAGGPAMNGGQLMAGVGQCERIGSWRPHYGPDAYAPGAAGDPNYFGQSYYWGAGPDF